MRRGLAAPYALVTGYAALLAIGTAAAALHGRFSATGVLIAAAAVVTAWSFVAEPLAVIPLAVVGWLTAVGFSHPPYAQLRVTGPQAAKAAIVIGACALAGGALGLFVRWSANRPILEGVGAGSDAGQPATGPGQAGKDPGQLADGQPRAGYGALMMKAAYAVGARRALLGVLVAMVGLPLLTALLVLARPDLSLTDDLLIYLVAVVALAVIGGFWPAVLAAASASLLLNWYFTPPLHTFTIDKPDNLLALLLFVTVAVAVSSVVHLAASRAGQAARSREEARSLLERVLANVFANALQHSPAGRPPALRAHQAADTLVLEVIDHGPGVPNELKSQIFEPFQRFDGRTAGVGLGLAVARGFTETMGGTIVAADTPGGGLTVRITLPIAGRNVSSMQGAES